jgi:arylsulfatase A
MELIHRIRVLLALFCCVIAQLASAPSTFAADAPAATREARAARRPNIVLILADDLGVGELGCYGQTKIRTPNIDRLAGEGVRFTQAYSSSPVCAPSRCCLLTGLHTGHAYVRDNKEVQPEGQLPMPADTVTIARVLHDVGYATACVGKWGLGPVGSSGDPNRQGFDYFFGDNCQRVAHNHYPTHLWRNDQRVELAGNVEGNVTGKQYAPDLMADDAIDWLRSVAGARAGPTSRANASVGAVYAAAGRRVEGAVRAEQSERGERGERGGAPRPFFLYFATPLPHVSLQAPDVAVAQYAGEWRDPPFIKDPKIDYVSCALPRATYAAMVTRIDDYVGRIVMELKALGVDDDTIVVFASDNGPTFHVGGADSDFFNSTSGLRGRKQEVYEGGIRVPLIVRWPGHVAAGTTNALPTALYDLPATFAEVAGAAATAPASDGVSLFPALTGHAAEQRKHDYLYWEYHSQGAAQALRKGDWKLVRTQIRSKAGAPPELYDLAADPNETTDVAAKHPDIVAQLSALIRTARTPSQQAGWNFEPAAAVGQ